MRMPTRLHITWENPTTLKVETDAGQQTRRFHFDRNKMAAGKSAPFPDEVARCLARMKAAHGHLPRPEAAGRRIAMR